MSLKVDLKSKEQRRGVSFDYGWIFVVIAVLLAFVVFYAYGLRLQGVIKDKQADLKTWQDKVAGFSGIQGKLQALQGDINSIQAQITKLRELRYDPLRYSILLVRLSKVLPPNIWLGNMSIDPSRSQITISGSSAYQGDHPPLASIAQLIMNLQNDKDGYFRDVVLSSTSSAAKAGDVWSFDMTASYNIPLISGPSGKAPEGAVPSAPGAQPQAQPPSSGTPTGLPAPEASSPSPEVEKSPAPGAPASKETNAPAPQEKTPGSTSDQKSAPETKGGNP